MTSVYVRLKKTRHPEAPRDRGLEERRDASPTFAKSLPSAGQRVRKTGVVPRQTPPIAGFSPAAAAAPPSGHARKRRPSDDEIAARGAAPLLPTRAPSPTTARARHSRAERQAPS